MQINILPRLLSLRKPPILTKLVLIVSVLLFSELASANGSASSANSRRTVTAHTSVGSPTQRMSPHSFSARPQRVSKRRESSIAKKKMPPANSCTTNYLFTADEVGPGDRAVVLCICLLCFESVSLPRERGSALPFFFSCSKVLTATEDGKISVKKKRSKSTDWLPLALSWPAVILTLTFADLRVFIVQTQTCQTSY